MNGLHLLTINELCNKCDAAWGCIRRSTAYTAMTRIQGQCACVCPSFHCT